MELEIFTDLFLPAGACRHTPAFFCSCIPFNGRIYFYPDIRVTGRSRSLAIT